MSSEEQCLQFLIKVVNKTAAASATRKMQVPASTTRKMHFASSLLTYNLQQLLAARTQTET